MYTDVSGGAIGPTQWSPTVIARSGRHRFNDERPLMPLPARVPAEGSVSVHGWNVS